MPATSQPAALRRVLGLRSAVSLGVASMLGAGVFFVWGPAAAAAGAALPIALLLAAVIASLNALSTMRLAVAHPVSGGAYAYGRAEVRPAVGFAAGVLFLVGKTASAAAIASVAAAYLVPGAARPAAVALIVLVATVNALGVRSTARVAGAIAALVVAAVLLATASGLLRLEIPVEAGTTGSAAALDPTPLGVLAAASLIFFAFAGYARIATLAEEVRDPQRTLPRAAVTALALVLALYVLLAAALLIVLGPERLAAATTPVAALAGEGWELPVRIVAALGALGSLLGVLAGLSRTGMAMARDRELPSWFAHITPRTGTPIRAEAVIAVVAATGALLLEPVQLVALSSGAVLSYYAIAHWSSLARGGRMAWRAIAIAGLVGCLVLVLATAATSAAAPLGLLVLAAALALALAGRAVGRRARGRTPS